MPNEFENAIKTAATKVAQYVADVSTLTVQTKYMPVNAGPNAAAGKAELAAETVIRLDGDCEAVVPVRAAESGGIEIETALFEVHERNVHAAIEYRARILNTLIGALHSRPGAR